MIEKREKESECIPASIQHLDRNNEPDPAFDCTFRAVSFPHSSTLPRSAVGKGGADGAHWENLHTGPARARRDERAFVEGEENGRAVNHIAPGANHPFQHRYLCGLCMICERSVVRSIGWSLCTVP